MPLDLAAERFLKRVNAARAGGGEPTLAALRQSLAQLAAFAAPAPEVGRADGVVETAGRRTRVRAYSPLLHPRESGDDRAASPGFVYFHGGGLVAGGIDSHDAFCATLAEGAHCKIIAVDYALAPENALPGPFDEALAAARAILADPARFGLTPGRIGLAGDSAGGALAIHVALSLRGAAQPAAALALICPALSVEPLTPSRSALGTGHLLEETTLSAYWRIMQRPGLAPSDPMLSPLLNGDLAGLPRTVLHVAGFDPLRDEGARFAVKLAQAGVDVRFQEHAGMIHHFYGLGGVIPAAREAVADFCGAAGELLPP